MRSAGPLGLACLVLDFKSSCRVGNRQPDTKRPCRDLNLTASPPSIYSAGLPAELAQAGAIRIGQNPIRISEIKH